MHALRRHLATCTESIIVRGPAGVAAQGSAMLDRLSDVGTLFDSLDQHLVTVALEGPERFVIDTTLAMAHAMALKDQLYEWLIDVQRAQLSPAETQVANQMLTDLDTAVSAVQREARRHV
ncbi:hypothetical protein [Streptomyces sp. bgisy130]|uniref:hypothetical protein n=1 Tax=Streptomyces sp. bgisy130 TaxID=3413788 RepID=UPI003F4A7D9C